MPSTRPSTIRTHDLPDIATVAEIAAFARVDPRTLRAEIVAGNVPGAFRVGKAWRILAQTYLQSVGGHHEAA
jgi:hypothetical protein